MSRHLKNMVRELAVRSPSEARRLFSDALAELVAMEPPRPEPMSAPMIAARFREVIGYREEERFAAYFMNRAGSCVGLRVFEGGSRTRTTLYPRELFKTAFELGATGVIIAHNHPGGTLLPSPQDRDLTRRVAELGESLECRLIDHYIVTPSVNYVSFKDKGWMF
jgi:DNA repair protein RadC